MDPAICLATSVLSATEYGSVGRIPLGRVVMSQAIRGGGRNPDGRSRRRMDRDDRVVIGSRTRPTLLRRSQRKRTIDLLFVVPVLLVLGGFLIYPLVYGVVLSVHDTRGFDLTDFVGLDHYAHAIFGDAVFHRSLLNTFLFTGLAVVLLTGLGLFLAVLIADAKRGMRFFQFAFFAPFFLAPVAVGTVWKFLYAPYFGVARRSGQRSGWTR